MAAVRALGTSFDDRPDRYVDLQSAKTRLPTILRDRVCLIVLDDVWSVCTAEVFANALGPRCRLLVTTRDAGLAKALDAAGEVLDDAAAVRLLAAWSEQPVSSLPVDALEVAKECGNLPLAIAMAGAMARKSASWSLVLERLRVADLGRIGSVLRNYPHTNVLRALEASISGLDDADLMWIHPNLRMLYLDLAVFARCGAIPVKTIGLLWGTSATGQAVDVRAKKHCTAVSTAARSTVSSSLKMVCGVLHRSVWTDLHVDVR